MAVTQEELMAFVAQELRLKEIESSAAMGKTRGWDSMAQVELVLSLEKKYGVHVPPDMFGELSTVPAILSFLNNGMVA